jgi:hypothetical protein
MRKIGPFLAIAALVTPLFLIPTESHAFGVRLGPFYFGFPSGHRRWHHSSHPNDLRDEASLNTSTQTKAGGLMSPLIYPVLALPALYGEIFQPPSSSPWPFSYDAIFQAAFAKAPSDQNANSCPQLGGRSLVAERIKSEIRPTPGQMPSLQKLGGALSFASDYLTKACPTDIPQDPAGRLQLMEWQIEKVAESLDMVRQPLQNFEGSLNDAQRAHFAPPSTAATAVHPDRPDNMGADCAAAPTKVDSSIEQISLAIEPTDAQRDAMNNLKQAFRNAASELDSNCPVSSSPDPLARLEATEARLDATWRALVSIQVALNDLEKNLNDDQRARLYSTNFAAAQ